MSTGWVQAILVIAAVLGALGIIWNKAIKPGAKIISQAEATIPLLAQLTKEWSDVPNLPQVLKEIVDQFKTNNGSSLRDAINRLETAATETKVTAVVNSEAVAKLRVQIEVNQRMAEQDRRYIEHLVNLVQTIDARVRVGVKGVNDIQTEQHGVAENLADAIDRANEQDPNVHGASSDAAIRLIKDQDDKES